jgi:hypothetical protein
MMKTQLGTFAIAVAIALTLKFLIFPDTAEFRRFFAASKTYLVPVLFVLLIFSMGLFLYALAKKVGPEQQTRMIKIAFWANAAISAIAIISVVTSVKLGIV